jgi:hypothetical protein
MAAGRSGTTTICRKIAKPRGKTLFGPKMLSTIACLAGRSPPVPARAFQLITTEEAALPAGPPPAFVLRGSPTRRPKAIAISPPPSACGLAMQRRESASGQCDPAHRRGRSRRHCGAAPSRGWSRSRPHRNRENGPWCGQSASDSCTILRANCVNQCHARKCVCVKQCHRRSVPKPMQETVPPPVED